MNHQAEPSICCLCSNLRERRRKLGQKWCIEPLTLRRSISSTGGKTTTAFSKIMNRDSKGVNTPEAYFPRWFCGGINAWSINWSLTGSKIGYSRFCATYPIISPSIFNSAISAAPYYSIWVSNVRVDPKVIAKCRCNWCSNPFSCFLWSTGTVWVAC